VCGKEGRQDKTRTVKTKEPISEDTAMEMETTLLSPQRKFNCLVLRMCIWNVNVRNVENDECCAVDVEIFSRRREAVLLRTRKYKLWLSAS